MATIAVPTNARRPISLIVERIASIDHKAIGRRYLVTAFIFLVMGGLEAGVMRWQLAGPDRRLLSPEAYNQLFTMHGVTMIFWYASPMLSGFSNYLFPLVLGVRDMAFPRLNALSYWLFLFSGVFLYSGFLIGQGPNAGWFAYAPLTGQTYSPGLHQDFYSLGLIFLSLSTSVGAINFIVTAFRLRAPGMRLGDLPLICWGTLTASFSILLALPPLGVACTFLFLDRRFGTHFYDASAGGSPLLWQHLFWIFGHPWVYVVVLPAMSLVSMIIPTFCGRPIVGYSLIVLSTVGTAALGTGVWMHHMFATGLSPFALDFFGATSLLIAIPSGIAVFSWLATIRAGHCRMSTAFLFSLGFLVLFTMGGVSGVMTGVPAFDWQLTDTYFVVAHLHYVLLGINVFPVIAAMYYWLPKITGRRLSERLGVWNFWIMFIGMNLAFFPMHLSGLRGMPRRIYTYHAGLGWDTLNLISTVGAFLFAIGVLLFLVNVWLSRRRGILAGNNPWDAGTLEWATSSPPPEENFSALPRVASRQPLWEERLGTTARSELTGGPSIPPGQALLTTAIEGAPEAIVDLPSPSLTPFATGVAVLFCFYGLVSGSPFLALLAAAAAIGAVIVWTWPRRLELEETP